MDSSTGSCWRRERWPASTACPTSTAATFALRDLGEMTTAEVAEFLGIDAAAVRQRVHRARLMLRGYLSSLVGVKP